MKDRENIINAVKIWLRKGEIGEYMCGVIRKNPDVFDKLGINSNEITALMDMKAKLAFYPDPLSFLIENVDRVNYIYTHLDTQDVELSDENEKRFADALTNYYSLEQEYKCRIDALVQRIEDSHASEVKKINTYLRNDDAINFIGSILFNKEYPKANYENLYLLKAMFDKYDMHDVYNMADNKILFQWKSLKAAESEGLLDAGLTEVICMDDGVNTDELENRVVRYKTDKLRINNTYVFVSYMGDDTYICCHVDIDKQEARKLAAEDVPERNPLLDITGLAVKYYQDVLERNRAENKAIVDEKMMERMNMTGMSRLIDIFHNGLNREDVKLLHIPIRYNKDVLLMSYVDSDIDREPVEVQKEWALGQLSAYIGWLKPGMLADDEVIRLTKIPLGKLSQGRAGEEGLRRLPEFYFPMIEQSGEYNVGMINYVKAIRGIGRIMPEMAYQGMEYFLSNRSEMVRDDVMDEYGRTIKYCHYPNENMENPAKMFVPNLLSERQWLALCDRYGENVKELIPPGAFRKDRITEVQVYPSNDGNMAIRCRVDGEQQSAQRLLKTDMLRYNEGTDTKELASGYFEDAFAKETMRQCSLER